MHVRFGSQVFTDVKIPVLWGKRAVIGHPSGEISIVDLSGPIARPEVVADKPWKGIEFSAKEDGFVILKDNQRDSFVSPARKIFRDIIGNLPECEISDQRIRIGTNTIQGGTVSGFQVGIGISENGFYIGGPVPSGLAELML